MFMSREKRKCAVKASERILNMQFLYVKVFSRERVQKTQLSSPHLLGVRSKPHTAIGMFLNSVAMMVKGVLTGSCCVLMIAVAWLYGSHHTLL